MAKRIVPLIVGNWKMNGLKASLGEVEALIAMLGKAERELPRVGICPPATLLAQFSEVARGTPLLTGGQDCHWEGQGAFTGDISAAMIADAGGSLVIVGHSERRAGHGETGAIVRRKAEQALAAALVPIICIGESAAEREAGQALTVVEAHLSESLPDLPGNRTLAVAYEPIWAIGTGVTPTLDEVEEVHANIRALLVSRFGERGGDLPILYGGSVKPGNAKAILALRDVDGALVGGACLLASDFYGIISCASI